MKVTHRQSEGLAEALHCSRFDRFVYFNCVFVGRKDCAGINVVAICDHRCVFTWVDYSHYGSEHDSAIFKEAEGYQFINRMRNTLDGRKVYLLGDAGFAVSEKIITPFRNASVEGRRARLLFNTTLSERRVTIERAFGIVKRRFTRLNSPLHGSISSCQKLIHSLFSLHNFLVKKGYEEVEILDHRGLGRFDALYEELEGASEDDSSSEFIPTEDEEDREDLCGLASRHQGKQMRDSMVESIRRQLRREADRTREC